MRITIFVAAIANFTLNAVALATPGDGEGPEVSYQLTTQDGGFVLNATWRGTQKLLARTDALKASLYVDDFDRDGCSDAMLFEGLESGFNVSVFVCGAGGPVRKIYAENVDREVDILDFDSDGDPEFVFFNSVEEYERRFPYYLLPKVYRRLEEGFKEVALACVPSAKKFYEIKLSAWAAFYDRKDALKIAHAAAQAGACPQAR